MWQLGLKKDLFVLKTLVPKHLEENVRPKSAYQNEIEQLRRFNGTICRHLVTLLASYERYGGLNFLFPYPKWSLEVHMEQKTLDIKDISSMLWLSKQLRGLMEAISILHSPSHLENQYGRHVELKSENILWYPLENDPNGILVVSDPGFDPDYRKETRFRMPKRILPHTPLYRLPESDIKGAVISRAYDIWTLGCLFLDMVIWAIGGQALRTAFSEARMTKEYLAGYDYGFYYAIMCFRPETWGKRKEIRMAKHFIQIKPEETDVSSMLFVFFFPPFPDRNLGLIRLSV